MTGWKKTVLGSLGLTLGLAGAPASAALYGLSSSTDSLYTIDAATGVATLIGSVGGSVSLSGLSFANKVLYGTDVFGVSGGPMVTLDTGTGAATGFSDQGGSINWHGLASTDSGLFYTIDIDDNNTLKSITAGGVITSIGFGTGIDGRGMAYDDGNGILYATGSGQNLLYAVDTGTGLAFGAGALGVDTSLFGLAYDEVNGILFGNSGTTNSLYRINVLTGAATLVGGNGVNGIDGLAWIDDGAAAIPVPAALPLLLGGLGTLAAIGRRRKSV